MDFKKRVLKFNCYGTDVELSYPTVGQFRSFQKQLKDKEADLDSMIDFLNMLGMDKKLTEELEPQHLNSLIVELVGSEKK